MLFMTGFLDREEHDKMRANLTLLLVLYATLIGCGGANTNKNIIKYKDGNTAKITIEKRITIDSHMKILVTQRKAYYPNGKLMYDGYLINGNWYSCKSFSVDGNIICDFNLGSGQLIIPDVLGNIPPPGVYLSHERMNCFCRNGDFMTEQEFKTRESRSELFVEEIMKLNKVDLQKIYSNPNSLGAVGEPQVPDVEAKPTPEGTKKLEE